MTAPSRSFIEMTPAQQERWERDIAALEGERVELNQIGRELLDERRAIQRDVIELLQVAREASGLTLAQLELQTGIHANQLEKLLQSDGNPTLLTLHRLAKALGKRLVLSLEDAAR